MVLSPEERCLYNIEAVLRRYGFQVPQLLYAASDRCFFRYDREFFKRYIQIAGIYFSHRREFVPRYSMEITFHGENQIEIDFDYWNPDFGLGTAFMHGLECAYNHVLKHKTDPFKIAAGLIKRGLHL